MIRPGQNTGNHTPGKVGVNGFAYTPYASNHNDCGRLANNAVSLRRTTTPRLPIAPKVLSLS
jgi:hypothetical protein